METATNLRSRALHPQRRPAGRGAQHGMALIEVLVSILLFAFGLLGLIGLEATAINLSVDSEDRGRAALLASEIASYMWATNSVTVPGSQVTLWNTNCNNLATETGLPHCTVYAPTVTAANSADIKITWIPLQDKTGTTRQLTTRVILP